jgi:F0F1-type ATP synthase delta subunit
MDQLDLSDFFKTKAQANDFSARLAAISQEVYKTDFDLDAILMKQFGLHKKDQFVSLLREKNIRSDSASDLKEFLTQLQEMVSTIPVLTLTIAFEPKEQTLKRIAEWFVTNIHRQVVFDIIIDPGLIAGAAISFNGKHTDFSIKNSFEQICNAVMDTAKKPEKQQDTLPEAAHIHLGR